MKELRDLIKACESYEQTTGAAALATVVKVTGSHYRRPGARMLMTADGVRVGAVSGGCFDVDLQEHARKVIASGQPTLLSYDTTEEDDIIWGSGTGCGGKVLILMEPFPRPGKLNPLAFIRRCFHRHRTGVIATVFSLEGEASLELSDRLTFDAEETSADFDDRDLKEAVVKDARAALESRRSLDKVYPVGDAKVEMFLEIVRPPVTLAVFGAGDDAVPLVSLARELGWEVTLIDHRPALATAERFPGADAIVVCETEEVPGKVALADFSAAVILTHNYLRDKELLKILLPTPVKYVGLLGARKRAEHLLQSLRKEETALTLEQLQRLHAPVGLDIGSEEPIEIALAIVSEIMAVLSGKAAGFLKDKKGALHL
jgi:xanthine/CO dehydrogenase XdhC/CoxF family maturation factor